MYDISSGFVDAAQRDTVPLVILGLRTVGGIGLHARHTPTLEQSGFTNPAFADGSWLADGSIVAGEGSIPLLTLRSDAVSFGSITDSLAGNPGELGGIFGAGRSSEIMIELSNKVEVSARRYFSWLAASDGIIGAIVDVSVTFNGLSARDALRRFSGIVERCELSPDSVHLRARAL